MVSSLDSKDMSLEVVEIVYCKSLGREIGYDTQIDSSTSLIKIIAVVRVSKLDPNYVL